MKICPSVSSCSFSTYIHFGRQLQYKTKPQSQLQLLLLLLFLHLFPAPDAAPLPVARWQQLTIVVTLFFFALVALSSELISFDWLLYKSYPLPLPTPSFGVNACPVKEWKWEERGGGIGRREEGGGGDAGVPMLEQRNSSVRCSNDRV